MIINIDGFYIICDKLLPFKEKLLQNI